MLYIFKKDGTYTGTTYPTDERIYRDHHEGQKEVCLWLSAAPALEIGDTLPDFDARVAAETAELAEKTKFAELAAIDAATVRPLRAVLASGDSPEQDDLDKLVELEARAMEIRGSL